MIDRLPLQIQTAYAELLEQLTALDAQRAIGHAGGAFVRKTVKGQEYYYYQHVLPSGTVQRYVGRRTPVLDRVVGRFEAGRSVAAAERGRTERLVAQLRAGGALTVDGASARVLAALADAAVFRLGGVLIGTNAYIVLGNMLGVRWLSGGLRTDDIDVAGVRTLEVALPASKADVPKVLDSLEMGFLPVPGLSPNEASTSFKVRGRSLRVDLLTPQQRGGTKPVPIPRFGAAAQPLADLGPLIEGAQPAATVGGSGILVQVPAPARFALHKLLVARARPASSQTKAAKDLLQAAQLIEVLAEDRPGELGAAWNALGTRRSSKTVRSAMDALSKRYPEAYRALSSDVG
jgi:hypothetical protein